MYSTDKVLQEIIYLLQLNGGKMNLLKLMKELYLADRESIDERETSISGDVFFSMTHGPVLSHSLNMCNDIPNNEWNRYLKHEKADYYPDIVLINEMELDLLSEKDKGYLKAVSDKYKDYTRFQLVDYTHTLPEWVNPQRSSRKIRFHDVMSALGKSENEIFEAKREHEQLESFLRLGC